MAPKEEVIFFKMAAMWLWSRTQFMGGHVIGHTKGTPRAVLVLSMRCMMDAESEMRLICSSAFQSVPGASECLQYHLERASRMRDRVMCPPQLLLLRGLLSRVRGLKTH